MLRSQWRMMTIFNVSPGRYVHTTIDHHVFMRFLFPMQSLDMESSVDFRALLKSERPEVVTDKDGCQYHLHLTKIAKLTAFCFI